MLTSKAIGSPDLMVTANNSLTAFGQMDEDLFNSWTALLEERTGMHLPPERRSFLETNLGLRMREIGVEDYETYFQHLLADKSGQREWLTLVDRLTVHETRFFRHQPSLDVLESIILPRLFEQEPERKKLSIWSAGCSTGEEAYTLCMIADQYVRQLDGKNCYLAVTGMDISLPALVTARKAVYEHYKIRYIPDHFLKNYFDMQPGGSASVIEEIKKRVCFVPFNIVDMRKTILEPMDIVFCQNVLIYFNRERRQQIVHDLVDRLRPGGFLVLGAGETMNNPHPELEKVEFHNALAFYKK
jgi:chemotaxis protein methyltransferase CheR/type IV pilus assembly protein PilK